MSFLLQNYPLHPSKSTSETVQAGSNSTLLTIPQIQHKKYTVTLHTNKTVMNKPQPSDIEQLKQAVETKFGCTPKTPTDFNLLAAAINNSSRDNIALSTLKRIWGYVPSTHTPTFSTLSILSRFAGHRDWDAFLAHHHPTDDSLFTPDTVIISSDEPLGTTLRIEWGHNKWCEIQKTAHPDRYRVTASMNIKLQPADLITVPTLLLHNMFTATDCTRNNQLLGTYAGARKEGITAIIRLPLDTPHS